METLAKKIGIRALFSLRDPIPRFHGRNVGSFELSKDRSRERTFDFVIIDNIIDEKVRFRN